LLQGIVVFDSNKKYHWYDAQRVSSPQYFIFAHLFVVLTTTSMSFCMVFLQIGVPPAFCPS